MSDPAESAQLRFSEEIELIGKATLGATAMAYAAGYCVVSLHSAQFGVSSLELLKPYYILAGLWLLLPLASLAAMTVFALAVPISGRWLTSKPTQNLWKTRLKRFAWALGIWISLMSIAIAIVVKSLPPPIRVMPDLASLAEYSRILAELAMSYCWIIGFSLFGFMFWRRSRVATDKQTQTLLRSMIAVFVVFLAFVSVEYLFWFSRTLFPRIPQYLGGGKPIVIRLLSSSTAADGVQVPTVDEARLSQPCQLLLEQGDSFVVRCPSVNGQVFRLEKDAYAGYLVVP